ncbi:hypothetical protein IJS77_00955 [bacterium]|nr:hypothetical protein [bacterium]
MANLPIINGETAKITITALFIKVGAKIPYKTPLKTYKRSIAPTNVTNNAVFSVLFCLLTNNL